MSGDSYYLNSIGIDIGTTTTQVIFSRLRIAGTTPRHVAPQLEIADRQILRRGDIHFTPLNGCSTIDYQGVKAIIDWEFRLAGLGKTDIHTGAVILTGQSVKKQNAREVADLLVDISGDFVVMTAGPHIESFLAGRGAGAARRSKQDGSVVVNIDIGGGTSNIAVFRDGSVIDSCCLNIGGRLLRINSEGMVTDVCSEVKPLISRLNSGIRNGVRTTVGQLEQLCGILAEALYNVVTGTSDDVVQEFLVTGELKLDYSIDEIMFSGGVADYIYASEDLTAITEISRYGDIGPLLGAMVRSSFGRLSVAITKPTETIRATVTGAGVQSLKLSGGTVLVKPELLPLKNIPVINIYDLAATDQTARAIISLVNETAPGGVALALKGLTSCSYPDIQKAAIQVGDILTAASIGDLPVVVITGKDCALVLGQTIATLTGQRSVMCIDQLSTDEGDYIDVGRPIDGKAVPVVVKTLLFG